MAELAHAAAALGRRRVDGVAEEVGMHGEPGPRCFYYLFEPVTDARSVLVMSPSFFELKTLLPSELAFARAAANAGHAVLYMQPPGAGESEGDPENCTFEVRVTCAVDATHFARARYPDVPAVCLMGARLGGAVALHACARAGASRLIMWDPVIGGSDYLRQAMRLEKIASLAGRRLRGVGVEEQIADRGWATLLGNVLTGDLMADLRSLEPPRQRVETAGLVVALNENRLRTSVEALESSLARVDGHALGKRDLGHLGFSPDDALAAIEPTLEWLEADPNP